MPNIFKIPLSWPLGLQICKIRRAVHPLLSCNGVWEPMGFEGLDLSAGIFPAMSGQEMYLSINVHGGEQNPFKYAPPDETYAAVSPRPPCAPLCADESGEWRLAARKASDPGLTGFCQVARHMTLQDGRFSVFGGDYQV